MVSNATATPCGVVACLTGPGAAPDRRSGRSSTPCASAASKGSWRSARATRIGRVAPVGEDEPRDGSVRRRARRRRPTRRSRLVERAVELVGVEFAERAARAVDDNVVLPVLFDVRQVRLPPEGGRTCGRGSVAFFAGKNCVSDHLVAPVACALSRREDIYAAEHGCRPTVREEPFTIQSSRPLTRTRAPSTAIAVAVLVWKKSGKATACCR